MNIFRWLCFASLLLLLNSVYAQNTLDSLIDLSNELSYQFKFDQAEEKLNQVIDEYPNSPLGYHYLSRNYLWFYLASKDEGDKIVYQKYSELALNKAEKIDSTDYKSAYIIGEIKLFTSMVEASQGNSMDAFWSTKSAVSNFEESLELNNKFYDPYLGLGIIKYALSFVQGFMGWAINITGLTGDEREGLNDIKLAYEKGNKSKVESAFHLGKIYTEYNAEYDSAYIYLSQLINDYPNNTLFLYQYAILMIDSRQLNEAEKNLDKILEINNSKFQQTNSFALFLKGDIAFKKNQFKNAIKFYDEFLTTTRTIDYTGLASLRTAVSYEMINKPSQANKFFILARHGNLDIPEDLKAKNDGEKYFGRILNNDQKNIIKAVNNIHGGNFSLSLNLIQNIDTTKIDSGELILSKLVEVEARIELDDFKIAKKIIESNLANEEIIESIYYPNFLFFYSKLFYLLGDFPNAEKYFILTEENYEDNYSELPSRNLENLRSKLKSVELR